MKNASMTTAIAPGQNQGPLMSFSESYPCPSAEYWSFAPMLCPYVAAVTRRGCGIFVPEHPTMQP